MNILLCCLFDYLSSLLPLCSFRPTTTDLKTTANLAETSMIPPNPPSSKNPTLAPTPFVSAELESIDGEAVDSDEAELTEINIRGFILNELDKMYNEYLICARPTLVEDESGNSLQVSDYYYTLRRCSTKYILCW